MLKSLYGKLTLAFVLVAFVTAALVAIFIRITSADRLTQLIVDQQRTSLEQSLSAYYQANGSWEGIDQNWTRIQIRPDAGFASTPDPSQTGQRSQQDHFNGGGAASGTGRVNFMGLAAANGKVIVSVDPAYPAGAILPASQLKDAPAITVNGQRVGSLLIGRQPPGFNPQENLFLHRTTLALIYAGFGALLVALIVGIVLSRTLTRPLQELTQASHRITQGQLEQQVVVRSSDEIGELAAAFNSMSQEVSRVNQQRKQMTADIAHDLRTPLTVISGYIESMRDGVLQPTPERLKLIYSEIERLQNMVGDLRMLSLADAGELSLNPQQISAKEVLEKVAGLFCQQAELRQVSIEVETGAGLPEMWADEARLVQVLGNLITNALRYTPAGGKIGLTARPQAHGIELSVEDNGEGIPAEDLPYIFDRFQRSDKSRHTENGESGLGLAIAKALVELHGGKISVESKVGSGTIFRIWMPEGQPAAIKE